jgi:hypothetical protein
MNGQRAPTTQKHQPQSPRTTIPRSPQPGNANALPNKPLPMAPDLMIPARQASRAKLAHEEKLRRRSMGVLREQEEKAKATQAQSGRKASMAEKVRSVTKRGSAQALSTKIKSPKPSDTRASASSKMTNPPMKSPKAVERDSAARSSPPVDVKEGSPSKLPTNQPNVAIELPAEVPVDALGAQEPSKKGGLHIHLGSKHKIKEHGAGPSSSKSLNIFRRSPHSPKPVDAPTESHPAEVINLSPKLAGTSPSVEELHQLETRLSQPSVPPPHRSSPDPSLPNPPALVPKNFTRGAEPNSYTALPDVLATAQRAKTVKAALRVSVPSSTEPEPEKTPRATPSLPSESVHTAVTLSEPLSASARSQTAPENVSEHSSYHSTFGEPGPEVPTLDTIQASAQQSTTTHEDEKTPTTSVRPHLDIPATSSTAPQEATVEPLDTPLTSATMRSYSDFYKLPPQQTSPSTPEGSVANHSIASSVSSIAAHSKTASIQEAETEAEPSKNQLAEQLSSTRSPPPKRAPTEKNSTNLKGLRLKPRNKDLQNQSELLDLIASTPPHSPIHARAPSDDPALSKVGMTASTSRILAPPDEAPPPPAPGGRSMIIPDYASAGAFEGERKPVRRGSGMASGGWKKMFAGGGGSAPAPSSGNGIGVLGIPGSQVKDEEIKMSANLMSGEGNDVLWYKGMGRDGLWVSGA